MAIMVGVFSVVVCAYLAAVYLNADARRAGDGTLVTYFRTRAAIAGVVASAVAGIGLIFLHRDVPVLVHGLAHRALALVVLSALAGIAAFILLLVSRVLLARVAAALAVTAVAPSCRPFAGVALPAPRPDQASSEPQSVRTDQREGTHQ